MQTTKYLVNGMTCEHCVRAVTSELSRLPNVSGVRIDVVPGGASPVTVTSGEQLQPQAVRDALDEAGGYTLVTP